MNLNHPQEPLPLHDAELVGIAIDRAHSTARLSFGLRDTVTVVELNGVKALRSEDLTLQNVVSRVLRSSKKQFSDDEIVYWITWSTSLSDATSWLGEKRKQDWIDGCESGVIELVVFEPSAGAQIAAVCQHVTFGPPS